MRKVVAAIDNSLAAGPVLAAAGAVAHLFDASLEAVHVCQNGHAVASHQARAAGLALRTLEGSAVESLAAAARAEEVAALVLGTRGTPGGRPVGRTALEVIGSIAKPVVVVPPSAEPRPRIGRVLLPLQGTPMTSMAPAAALHLAADADVEVVVLHVLDEQSVPSFTDQPQHETHAWATEFLARFCPHGLRSVRLELRVGRPAEEILRVADDIGADLIALGWNQELEPGRAVIVRAALERGTLPLLLIPAVPPPTARFITTSIDADERRRYESARVSRTG
jgi:nucleotide-binding universal stress UspA family protein